VVVDEVGYTPVTQVECHLIYLFVASNYEHACTIITSNKAFSDWAELFHDQVLVSAKYLTRLEDVEWQRDKFCLTL
jgi:DNA replication protein DnaC